MTVWRIRYGVRGWLRDVHSGRPIISGIAAEAEEWPPQADAVQILEHLRRRRSRG